MNNFKLKVIYSFVIMVCLTLTSCEKDNVLSPSPKEALTKDKSMNNKSDLDEFKNPNNPYDEIGYYHNVMYNQLQQYEYPINDTGLAEATIKIKTVDVFQTLYPNEDTLDLDCLNNVNGYEGYYASIDYYDYGQILGNVCQGSGLFTSYIDDLLQLNIVSGMSPTQVNNMIMTVENNYINNMGGNTTEFYVCSAIIRYSFILHYQENEVPLSGKWKLALADAIGGVIGGFVGCGAFSVLTGLQGAAAATTIASHFL